MTKKISLTINAINKKYGDGLIAKASDIEQNLEIKRVSSGILLLDILLNGGIPKSSIITLYGKEGSGKTLTALYLAALFTKQKKAVAFIDEEHKLDLEWAKKIGVDTEYFFVSQPDDLEKGVDIADSLVRSGEFALVIFDSLTAAIPREEIDKSAMQVQVALQARLNSKAFKKFSSGLQPENLKDISTYNNTIVLCTAHLRDKVGTIYGNPEILPGGHCLKHNSHYIIKTNTAKKLAKEKDIIGIELRYRIEKASYSKPYVVGITDFYFDPPRFDNTKTLILYSVNLGIVTQKGAFYTYKDKQFKGKKELIDYLRTEKKELEEIKTKIIEEINK